MQPEIDQLTEIVLATHNQGKIKEFRMFLETLPLKVISSAELNLPEPDETGTTYEENAALKARAAAEITGKPSLADDSGLSVTALNGDPGIYSARWAGKDKDYDAAFNRLNNALAPHPDKHAQFICVLALAYPDGRISYYHGEIDGEITWPPRGTQGFGYDPLFIPSGHDKTFAELDQAAKANLNHRKRAFDKLVGALLKPQP